MTAFLLQGWGNQVLLGCLGCLSRPDMGCHHLTFRYLGPDTCAKESWDSGKTVGDTHPVVLAQHG